MQDVEKGLEELEEHEKRLEICKEILAVLDWEKDECGIYKKAVGEAMYAMGQPEEGLQWFPG